jgi:transposase
LSPLLVADIMIETKPTIIELDMEKREDLLQRIAAQELQPEDYETFKALIDAYAYLTELVGDKSTTIRRLRQMLFGAKTEKTAAVVGDKSGEEPSPSINGGTTAALGEVSAEADAKIDSEAAAEDEGDAEQPARGHGRNGADAYTGAEKIDVSHDTLSPGDPCPKCEEGTVYETGRPGVVVRFTGQAPIQARVYYLQKLRCNLCGALFTADAPEGARGGKYDATVGSMIALLKYGTGMPFHRDARLQASLGIPLPASTQWDIVHGRAERAEPVFEELVQQGAQGEIMHNDDTTVKILEMMGERARQAAEEKDAAVPSAEAVAEGAADAEAADDPGQPKTRERRGMFTSGIVSISEGRRIALFFSGRQHAGENLADVLSRRAAELPPPLQMCDALSRNLPAQLQTIVAHCLAHGRRKFVEVAEQFPGECRHVLESLAVIYRNDAVARRRKLSPGERLRFHQAKSGPVMEELHVWLGRQFVERLVEPNSSLGGAISYLLKHWERLTLFLRRPGAPLDNNICERALKKAILHRKNALFYKTHNGAHAGDIFMSLIYTCELNGINPFDYLTALERHAGELAANPQNWMPWNYRETLAAAEAVPASAAAG